jgi:hypothetical protein
MSLRKDFEVLLEANETKEEEHARALKLGASLG